MKIYRMIVEPISILPGDENNERKSYTSPRAGSAPSGYRCVAVVGYYEKSSKKGEKNYENETDCEI